MLDNVAIASITPQYLSLVRVEIIINSYRRNFLLFTGSSYSYDVVRTTIRYCYFSHHRSLKCIPAHGKVPGTMYQVAVVEKPPGS